MTKIKREFKGTQGPWTEGESKKGLRKTISGPGWGNFCKVVTNLQGIFGDPYLKKQSLEGEANARAILAVPEMIDAMIEFCDRVENGDVKSKHTYNRFKTILDKVL